MTPPPDYATWLTKQQAADAIGVTTKSIERFVQAGQIQQARWQREGRGPLLAVYHPDDVARLAQERQPGPLPAFLVPGRPGDRAPANGNGHEQPPDGLARVPADSGMRLGSAEDLVRAFLTTIAGTVSQTSETLPLFVTIDEAAALSGLSRTYLRRLIEAQTLPAIRDRGWRIRRKDLEAL